MAARLCGCVRAWLRACVRACVCALLRCCVAAFVRAFVNCNDVSSRGLASMHEHAIVVKVLSTYVGEYVWGCGVAGVRVCVWVRWGGQACMHACMQACVRAL